MLLTKSEFEEIARPIRGGTSEGTSDDLCSGVGTDARESQEYEEIRFEIEKLTSFDEETPNWNLVEKGAISILQGHSKDLNITSYLVLALNAKYGVDGLLRGLELLVEILGNFGNELFPLRRRARVAALEWLSERLDSQDKKYSPSIDSRQKAEEISASIERFETCISEFMGDDKPKRLSVGNRAAQFINLDGKKKTVEKATLSGTGLLVPGASQEIASEQDAIKVEKAVSSLNLKLASYYRKNDIRKTAGYKRLRDGLWGNVSMLPPNTSGKTQLPPVMPNERHALQSLENVPESLEKLEVLMQRYPFWLDIQKKVFNVCKALGRDYQAIAELVCTETHQFVSRLQGIEDLQFSDLSPLASNETKDWIKSLANTQGSQFTIKIRRFDSRWKKIEKGLLASGGEIGTERLLSIMDRISQSRNSSEEYFQVLMIAAKVFAERNRFDLSSYCVSEMEEQVEKHKLTVWNRKLVLDLYRLKLDVLRGKNGNSENVDVGMELENLNKQMIGLSLLDAYNSEI